MDALRRLCFVWLVAALAPMWLGPLLLPIQAAIAEAHHVCACGMVAGTCGCPECERLEQANREDSRSSVPILKGECSKGAPLLGAPALPPVLMPAGVTVRPATVVALLEAPSRASLASRAPPPPLLPPPLA